MEITYENIEKYLSSIDDKELCKILKAFYTISDLKALIANNNIKPFAHLITNVKQAEALCELCVYMAAMRFMDAHGGE